MPTETNLHTIPTLAPAIPQAYLKKELLSRAEKALVFWAIAKKAPMPTGEGTVIQFNRFERMPLPEAPLEESVTPVATPISITAVQAVLDQWGAVASFSDRIILTIAHPIMQEGKELLSDQHNETLDREIQVVTMGASAVYFANQKASRANLVSTDVLTSNDMRRVIATLRQLGARPYEGGMFKGVVDPFVEADINADAVFQAASQYSNIVTLQEFEIGRWLGTRWFRSNNIPILSQMAAAWVTQAAVTGGAIPAGGTGFTAASTVRTKVTKLDDQTKQETIIDSEASTTDAAIFGVAVTIAAVAPTGTYLVYSSLEGGAAGTPTLQVRVRHTTGTAQTITFVRSGSVVPNAYVVVGSGRVAPPDAPAGFNVHLSYVFGKDAIAASTLDQLRTYVTPANQASDSDPLAQRRKMGWKQDFKAVVLNNDYFRRIESASAYN